MEPQGTHSAVSNRIRKPVPRGHRRAVRQKVHTPAYASLNGGMDDMVLDLSEIIDISETGAAIQTSSSWEISRVLNLCLDLSETQTYLNTTGYVVWADRSGRIGVRFPQLPDESRRKLQEWLFLNAMVGASNFAARNGERESDSSAPPKATKPKAASDASEFNSRADYTTTLTALSAVQREVEAVGPNLSAALQLIAERARAFTEANGCAIALAENRELVCRASAGDAPPVGARLAVGSGFSGYCVRSGFMQRCDDAETDSRVDRESCRSLGIRSMIAVPIRLGETVMGLLEVFSSQANAFNDRHGTMLQRLADTILAAVNRATRARLSPSQPSGTSVLFGPTFGAGGANYPFATSGKEEKKNGGLNIPQSHLTLLVIAAVSIVIALGYFLMPWVIDQFRPAKKSETTRAQSSAPLLQPTIVAAAKPLTLEEVRKRAENGDPYEQVALAARYVTGEDVSQDYSMAARWFLRAAEQGHVGAQDTLGAYYSVGRGVPKDLNRAYYWSVLASDAGKETSRERLAFMTSQLTPAQAISIQQEARKFMKQHPALNNSDIAH